MKGAKTAEGRMIKKGNKKRKEGRKEGQGKKKREVRYTRSRLSTWQTEGLQLRKGEKKREKSQEIYPLLT